MREIVRAGDESALENLVNEVATFCFKEACHSQTIFPDDVFDLILDLLRSESFRKMPGGYHLLLWIEYDWATLSPEQKRRLLCALEEGYTKFSDWMCCFVASEILGRFFADEDAFSVAERLRKTCFGDCRALLPSAYEKFLIEAKSPSLRRRAARVLSELQTDPSPEVRSEVRESERRLRSQGRKYG